jgi:hypothetical protein
MCGRIFPEQHGMEWGDSLRKAVKESCESLPQRNGFVEAGFRIASAKRRNRVQLQVDPAEELLPTSADTKPVENAEQGHALLTRRPND